MKNDSPKIISNTYRIIGEIGSGGGGIVYLAEHLRLNKKVVLKSDKRSLSSNIESLRREVDSLKNLNHTYIPQVYDFIEENGEVFTVMDYIEGESFDKPLKRGIEFKQANIIEWACQLLEALSYLHSREPYGILHADIKPANVMLTPSGEVRLIDFNIALALGEEGAISVGRSFGYASPEHYGIDYPIYSTNKKNNPVTESGIETDISNETKSFVNTVVELNSEKSLENSRKIMLDARSDIYSLGATLYHIITGEKPNRKATEVIPISDEKCSESVIRIVSKAMNPNPDLRYQSAKEMLYDFKNLREQDERFLKFKKNKKQVLSILILIFFLGGITTFTGMSLIERKQRNLVMIEYSRKALEDGNKVLALEYAMESIPKNNIFFLKTDTSKSQRALSDALNIYDLSDGFKHYKTIELPSPPILTKISADGKIGVSLCDDKVIIFDTEEATIVDSLEAEKSALSEIAFIGDEVLVYSGINGLTVYNIAEKKEIWTGEKSTAFSISEDKSRIAAIYKDKDFATIYNLKTGEIYKNIYFNGKTQTVTVNDIFANPMENLFSLNEDGSLLGVSFENGELWIYSIEDDEHIQLLEPNSEYKVFQGGFYKEFFAFSASSKDKSIFAVIDTINLEQTGGFESEHNFSVNSNKDGIFVKTENILVRIDPLSGEQKPLVNTSEYIFDFTIGKDYTAINDKSGYAFFDKNAQLISKYEKKYENDKVNIGFETALVSSHNSPKIIILKYESNSENQIFSQNLDFHYDEARVSLKYNSVMFFSYNEVGLYNMEGGIINRFTIPNNINVYDQQFRRTEGGDYLEVIFNDGTVIHYSAENGNIINQSITDKPDLTLYEEFFTSKFRIESPLHGTPMVYDRETNNLIRELEKDSYLTYVTEVGDYIITEYITSNGYRYGLLLDQNCETLAYLPNLTDIVSGNLIFRYQNGDLRKSNIYEKEELILLAKNKIELYGGKK